MVAMVEILFAGILTKTLLLELHQSLPLSLPVQYLKCKINTISIYWFLAKKSSWQNFLWSNTLMVRIYLGDDLLHCTTYSYEVEPNYNCDQWFDYSDLSLTNTQIIREAQLSRDPVLSSSECWPNQIASNVSRTDYITMSDSATGIYLH